MRRPNCDPAEVDRAKVVDYLLNPAHPFGESKARFFSGSGFTLDSWDVLAEALRRHGRPWDVVRVVATGFGPRFEVDGPPDTPDGLQLRSRTVWQLDTGRAAPRLVTQVSSGEAMIQEHDCVVLTSDLPDAGLKAGDVGTVVHVLGEGAAYEVEFVTLTGDTVAVAAVPAPQQRPVSQRDISHVRDLAAP